MDDNLIKKRFVSVDKSDPVSKLIGQLKLNKAKSALVFDRKRFLGIADTHLLVRTKLDPRAMKVKRIIKKVPVLHGDEDVKETARLLFTAETRCLPVAEEDRIIGVVNAVDLIKKLKETEDADKPISKVMTLSPIVINEEESVGKAISIMREKHISRMPVIDEQGNLINIAALTDMLFSFTLMQQSKTERRGRNTFTRLGPRTIRAFRQRIDLNSYPIKNLTPANIITASPTDTLSRAIDKMERFDISSIIIVRDRKPVGIATIRDFLRLLLKDQVTY